MKRLQLFFVIAVLACCSGMVKSQTVNEGIYFSNLPQSNLFNPALNGNNMFYINVPVVGKLDLGFKSSGFCYIDLVPERKDDSTIVDFQGFISKLKDDNFVDIGLVDNLFGFGFRVGKNHFSFGLSMNLEARLDFTQDLFDLIVNGTENFQSKNAKIFDDKFINFTSFFTASLGYSRDVSEKLSFGANAKMYMGVFDISTDKTNISLDLSDNNKTKVLTDIHLNTSISFVDWDVIGKWLDGKDVNYSTGDVLSNAMDNIGFGIDLGFNYKLNESMQISASVVDLGYIKWAHETNQIVSRHPNTPIDVEGIEDDFDNYDEAEEYAQDLIDTIKYAFDLKTISGESYTTMIPTKIYLGYSWNFLKFNYFNALYKGRFINGEYENSLMLNYSFKSRLLQLSISNTFTPYNAFNPSALVSVADFVYLGCSFSSSMMPNKADAFTVFGGVNVAFKNFKTKKVEEEAPISFLEK